MSAVATAIVGGAVVGGVASNLAAGQAADATDRASQRSVDAQMAQLDYLKQVDALPKKLRERAISRIGEAYGLGRYDKNRRHIPGTEAAGQRDFFKGIESSPLYKSMIEAGEAGKMSGEESILRNAAATGGLRSGNVSDALYQYNTQFDTELRNKALLATYQDQMTGLRGLGNLPGQTENIAGVMGNIGTTQAQAIMAQGQIAQQGIQGIGNAVQSGIGNYLYARGQGII